MGRRPQDHLGAGEGGHAARTLCHGNVYVLESAISFLNCPVTAVFSHRRATVIDIFRSTRTVVNLTSSGSQAGSQQQQYPGDAEPRSVTIDAGQRHTGRRQATFSDPRQVPSNQRVAGRTSSKVQCTEYIRIELIDSCRAGMVFGEPSAFADLAVPDFCSGDRKPGSRQGSFHQATRICTQASSRHLSFCTRIPS
jgi:hypothetical protein